MQVTCIWNLKIRDKIKLDMKKIFAPMGLAAFFSIFCLQNVAAKESLLLAGFQAGTENEQYYYFGGVVPLRQQDKLGNGWVQTWWIDNATYQFTSGATLVRAQAPGLRYSIGRQYSRKGAGGGWQLGVSARNTRLNPSLPMLIAKGLNTGIYALLEGQRDLRNRWKLGLIGSSVAGSFVSYWARVRLVKTASSERRLQGIEYVISGDPDYQLTTIAYVNGGWKVGDARVTARAGISKTRGMSQSVFIGFEWVRYRSGVK